MFARFFLPQRSRLFPSQPPSRSRAPPFCDQPAASHTPVPGTVFYCDGSYVLFLPGLDEHRGKPHVAFLDSHGDVECFSSVSYSSRRLGGPISDALPTAIAEAVRTLLDDPPFLGFRRAPRRPGSLPPLPASPRLHPQFPPLAIVLGPVRCPLPPPRSLAVVLSGSSGPPAPPRQARLLTQWGIMRHPRARLPGACLVFSTTESAVRRHLMVRRSLSTTRRFYTSTVSLLRLLLHPVPCVFTVPAHAAALLSVRRSQ